MSYNNKDKKILRGWITRILSNEKEIQKDFDSLEPKERLGIIVQLINYSLPKMRSTEITTDQDLNININREVIGGSESKN